MPAASVPGFPYGRTAAPGPAEESGRAACPCACGAGPETISGAVRATGDMAAWNPRHIFALWEYGRHDGPPLPHPRVWQPSPKNMWQSAFDALSNSPRLICIILYPARGKRKPFDHAWAVKCLVRGMGDSCTWFTFGKGRNGGHSPGEGSRDGPRVEERSRGLTYAERKRRDDDARRIARNGPDHASRDPLFPSSSLPRAAAEGSQRIRLGCSRARRIAMSGAVWFTIP